MQKVAISSLIYFTIFVSIATAKYIPQFNQNKSPFYKSRFRQMLTRSQNHRFSKSDNTLSNQAFDGKARTTRNRKQVFDNSPAVNTKTGLSIQIGNHQIQHTSNGIRVRLGVSSKQNNLNSVNQRQFRMLDNPANNFRQVRFNPGQSRLTRIILMRNGKNGARRNFVLKTSRGAKIHISRNTGTGSRMKYIINTGRVASGRPSAMSSFNKHLLSMRNEINGSNGFGQNLNIPTTSPLFEQTTVVPDLSTTEPEDIDLYP